MPKRHERGDKPQKIEKADLKLVHIADKRKEAEAAKEAEKRAEENGTVLKIEYSVSYGPLGQKLILDSSVAAGSKEYVQDYAQKARDFKTALSAETEQMLSVVDMSIGLYAHCVFERGEMGSFPKTKYDHIRVLDVGCGNGYVIRNIAPQILMKNRYAMDIAYENLALLNGIPINQVLADVCTRIPLDDDFFDIVVCSDVLEHVLDVEAAVAELKRVVKPLGWLIVAVPWKQDLSVYESDAYKKNFKQYKFNHQRSFGPGDLERLIAAPAEYECETETVKGQHGDELEIAVTSAVSDSFCLLSSCFLTVGKRFMKLQPFATLVQAYEKRPS